MKEYTSANNDINEGELTLKLEENAQQAHAELDAYKVILEGGADAPVRNIDHTALFEGVDDPITEGLKVIGEDLDALANLLPLLPEGRAGTLFKNIVVDEMRKIRGDAKGTPQQILSVLGEYKGEAMYQQMKQEQGNLGSMEEVQKNWYTNVLPVLSNTMNGVKEISDSELGNRIRLVKGMLQKQQGNAMLTGFIDFEDMPDLGDDANGNPIILTEETYVPNIQQTLAQLKAEQKNRAIAE